MAVRVFGCNHVVLEVGDIKKAIEFYTDAFNLELKNGGGGDAFFHLGNHQFLALFEADEPHVDYHRHFGLIVRDAAQVAEVREKITRVYGLKTIPPFRSISATLGEIEFKWLTCTTNPPLGSSLTRKSKSSVQNCRMNDRGIN